MKKAVHMLFILAVVLSGFAGVLTITPPSEAQYTPHDPIHIEGNEDFVERAIYESWPGNGTRGNPYIIEEYEINANNSNGIEIRSTTLYFVIKSVVVENGWSLYDGIYLYNVTNGYINSCILNGNRNGTTLYYSSENRLEDNNASSNRLCGICLISSNNNTLKNNTCNYNRRSGVYLCYFSNDNIIEGNTCFNNFYGIWQESSLNNSLIKNECYSSKYFGIYIGYSSKMYLKNNICNLNNGMGIVLDRTNKSLVENNTGNLNNWSGIVLHTCYSNIVSGNNAFLNNDYGIGLFSSSDNFIRNNIATANSAGIYLAHSKRNTISGNNLSYNEYGIHLYDCRDNPLLDNLFLENNDNVFRESKPNGTSMEDVLSGIILIAFILTTLVVIVRILYLRKRRAR